MAEFVESGRLILARPLLVDGKDVTKIRYDFDKITGMKAIDALDKGKQPGVSIGDCSERSAFLLFAEAVKACHVEMETTDLERLHAKDIILGARLGKGFFIRTCMEALTRIGEE